jgi:hypothetical protein
VAGYIVITTIQAPGPSVLRTIERAGSEGLQCIIVGDRKTPETAWTQGVEFLGLARQRELGFELAPLLPENHYARKNIGYLQAMRRCGDLIFDTDDDNAPLPQWRTRPQAVTARTCLQAGWVNAYRWFTRSHIWPRGLPLPHAHAASEPAELGESRIVQACIQQGLANGSPDVDAIWRLLLDQDFAFDHAPSAWLPAGSWCPFNSQSTWWFPAAYPLMYLASFVSFRMTDIWRSLIAQRCLWAMGRGVVFHGPEVFQDRNEHNLMRDFEQEVPGYLGNERFRQVLEALELDRGEAAAGANLRRCYEALVAAGLIEARELPLVDAWLRDVQVAARSGRGSA